MVTITDHVFTDISPREYLLAVKFLVGNEKNMEHLLVPKSQKVWKKVEQIGLGSFKDSKTLEQFNLAWKLIFLQWHLLITDFQFICYFICTVCFNKNAGFETKILKMLNTALDLNVNTCPKIHVLLFTMLFVSSHLDIPIQRQRTLKIGQGFEAGPNSDIRYM